MLTKLLNLSAKRGLVPLAPLFFSLAACGTHKSSLSKSFQKEKTLLIFAMGGRNSCGQEKNPRSISMYPRVAQLVKRLSTEFVVTTIITCYDRYGSLFVQIEDEKAQKSNPEGIASLSDTLEKERTLLVGHSYGGWLAMQTTLALKDDVELVTIDAISPVECQLSLPKSWFGCQRAPRDISSKKVGASTKRWQNFFQTSTLYLHSSEIPEAQNEHIPNVGHTQIDDQPQVWEKIESEF